MGQLGSVVWWMLCLPLAAQAPVAPLVGTVFDPLGKPVKDAIVRVARCDGRLFRCLDLALRNEWVEVATARTDKVGRFGLQVPLGLALAVEVDLPPFARWRSESVVPGENLTVRLEAACSVKGQLVDAVTGKGTPGSVRAWHPRTKVDLFSGRTDAEGHFHFGRLPSGTVTWSIQPDAAMIPRWTDFELASGEQLERVVKLDPGVVLTGTVVDAATGEPIVGAAVGEGWVLNKAVRSDAAGKFLLRGFGAEGYPDVHCTASGYARVRIDRVAHETDPARLDIALHRGVPVVGRVVDAEGKPLANAYVAAIGYTDQTVPWQSTRTDANGEFACDGFPRRTEGVLMVRYAGFASVVYFLPGPAGDGQIDFGSVVLRTPLLVRGTVQQADGTPAVNAQVCLRGVNADAGWLAAAPSTWGFLSNYVGERHARSDGNGAFAFGDVPPGEYVLTFVNEPNAVAVPVTVQAGEEVPPVQLSR